MGPGRIGLLGGSFDPIHYGHLILAEEARHSLSLDRVVFVPAGQPPHKRGRVLSASQHRLAMTERAIASEPAFVASRLDLDRPGPHYTVDLVRLFLGQAASGAELFFLMGADSLEDLLTWRDPAGLLALCQVAAFSRPGHLPDTEWLAQRLPAVRERVRVIPMPLIGISASDIRQRVRQGRPIRYLLPEAVRDYIVAEGLYLGKVEEPGDPTGQDR
ncbi:MAG: nicotinate-nucleotide adenylyltransferase [Chloroflexi bacterium]|nr:nicotinate-nucleotide adenylyltransferase [Chloroflexota bacterium]